jgi:hypothetical protein
MELMITAKVKKGKIQSNQSFARQHGFQMFNPQNQTEPITQERTQNVTETSKA